MAFEQGSVKDFALEIRHVDGTRTPVLYNASVYRDDAGNVEGVFAAARDITTEQQARDELTRANRALRTRSKCIEMLIHARTESTLFEDICRVLTTEGGYRLAWVGLVEHDAEKTVRPVACAGFEAGYLDRLHITWSDTDRGRGPTGIAIRTGQPSLCRNLLTDPNFAPWREDALRRGYASSIVLPLLTGNEVIGALNIYAPEADAFDQEEVRLLQELAEDLAFGIVALRNRMERLRAEEAFRRASEYNRTLIEANPDPMVTIGPDGTISDVNAATQEATGCSRSDLIGTDFSDYFTEPEKARSGYQQVFRDGFVRDYPLAIRHASGRVTDVLYNASVYRDADGKVLGVFAAARDITRQKRAEDEIRTLNAELEQRVARRTAELESVNKELEAFAYSVSHDLRAPLRSIDGFSAALLEDYAQTLDERGRDYFQRIRKATERMSTLIDDILELSRITHTEMHIQDVNLSSMAHEVVGELRCVEPERRVDVCIADNLIVRGDQRLLRIVVENLLDNAWKFTRNASSPKIEFDEVEQNGKRVFFVADNGVGFDMEYASRLFGVFQRLHHATEFPGTGVGLATVQRILHRHGGTIWATSTVNQGARFHFTLTEGEQP